MVFIQFILLAYVVDCLQKNADGNKYCFSICCWDSCWIFGQCWTYLQFIKNLSVLPLFLSRFLGDKRTCYDFEAEHGEVFCGSISGLGGSSDLLSTGYQFLLATRLLIILYLRFCKLWRVCKIACICDFNNDGG